MNSPISLKVKKESAEKVLNTPIEKSVPFIAKLALANQIGLFNTMDELIVRKGGDVQGGLAASITDTLYSNYRRFGEKAYPASEKQIKWIIEDMIARRDLTKALAE